MAVKRKYDTILLGITLTLVLVGFFVLASASLGLAAQTNKNSYAVLIKQVGLGMGLGFIFFLLTSRIHYKRWEKIALPFFLFSFFLTLLVFIPHIGIEAGGAKRWINLGFSFQPSELLKFSFVIYLASWLSKKKKEIPEFKTGLLPFLVIVGFVGATLVFQPDLGTLGVISITATAMFFLAGGRYTQVGLFLLIGLLALGIFVAMPGNDYAKNRIIVFFNNTDDIQGIGYQLNQAKIAIGSGGLFGKGFGEGLSKFNYLPQPIGDSIFAVVAEEFGFVGTTFLILLFLAFLWRAFQIALRAPDRFGRLLASGIAILIIGQSFINMYTTVGLVPFTGLPLIFISQGGSALALALAEVGILLNISRNSK